MTRYVPFTERFGSAPPVTDEPLSPACMKCERVTGRSTCFPGPCVFYHERSTPGSKSHNIATLDRIRRGVADVSDASEFPNIAEARRWLDSLSPERRAELNADWSK